ncbi:MAG: hypothetical protein R2932_18910 [Caldilineaceae bacterium]
MATGNVLHLLWQQDGTGFYARYIANQGWTEAEQIGRFMLATADTNGTLHLVQSPIEGTTSHYRTKPLDASWSDRVPLSRPNSR